MKKTHLLFMTATFAAILSLFSSCTGTSSGTEPPVIETPQTDNITHDEIIIDGTKDGGSWFFWTHNLEEKYYGKTVKMDFSCEMLIENPSDEGYLMWQVNNGRSYPKIAECSFKKNETEYKKVSGSKEIEIANGAIFYLSNYNEPADTTFNNSNFKIHIKNFNLTINYTEEVPDGLSEEDYWLNVPSIKEVYKNHFEHIGFAVTETELLNDSEKAKGLKYHATSITMGNEFKPDFIFNWGLNKNTATEKYTSEFNGKIIDVPETLSGFTRTDLCLSKCKELGIKMRGHVLVWYSQTPKAFFCENYDETKSFVDKETMTARQEWYIKTVLNHVKEWENQNNNGEHIIYTWDVVNEALSDGAKTNAYLRPSSNSNWAKVYGDENYEFIINAFRFANKFAPSDVALAYNDYNEASGEKFKGYLKIIDEIQKHENDTDFPTRLDIAGMQSHNQPAYPSLTEYENAIKSFIEKGLDVQVTELDITGTAKDSSYQTFNPPTDADQKKTYNAYYKLYRKYAKTEGKSHGVTGVTIWGINDEDSWRASGKPLLFKKINSSYYVKDAYHGVIEAAE